MNHAAICENGQHQGNPAPLLQLIPQVRTTQLKLKPVMTLHQKHLLLDSLLRSSRVMNMSRSFVVLVSVATLLCNDGRGPQVLR
jgi:hypothetical protein